LRDFRELEVWRKAHALTLAVYGASASFPREELYGLTSQIRRSAASVPTNIAEGCGRDGPAELAHFLQMARGSANELDYQLLLAHDLHFYDDDSYDRLKPDVMEVKRMLSGFINTLKGTLKS
jgi:four helix bundle protein